MGEIQNGSSESVEKNKKKETSKLITKDSGKILCRVFCRGFFMLQEILSKFFHKENTSLLLLKK